MKKTIIQGLAILLSFFLIWFGFSQLDYVKFFKIKERTINVENKLGDLIWNEINRTEDVVLNDSITKTLDSLILPICKANNIERDSLKVHIIDKDEVNAFALPNKHLVVYTGLIVDCKKQEALQGVLGHEIAHIEKNHVMKKLSKELGFSVLLSATTGGKGGQLIKEVFKTLSSSAYDRTLEKEADITSVDYMIEADIDPKPMADFMYQMSLDSKMPDGFSWISTHPESEERSKYILEYIKGKKLTIKPTLTEKNWKDFQEQIKDL
ncbi:M48 family metallopeptidase [Flavobacterium capsici]|uniref:M48 family metallopeptidase n=1 Tax=Flavobacterium capsici TaxID=3075618 RepID=A0AA96EZM4_9FLAO|nr:MULTISPECIES: M48 family metallopeptidase [unclassified Flavobacterium]WNM19782.1 M48 family metallopeptidase [Flavobacterium sp. PMR2A8]WNM21171.1 M48 family metallopeptidase [Flavobacterium sp. PMTSA4]